MRGQRAFTNGQRPNDKIESDSSACEKSAECGTNVFVFMLAVNDEVCGCLQLVESHVMLSQAIALF